MADFASIRFQPSRPLLRELSADRLNSILTEIRRNKPKGERGITVRQDGTGTYIGLAAALPKGGTSTPATPQPWDLIARLNPDNENQYLITVQPGTLNGVLPANWNQEFACDETGLFYAKAVISTDGASVTGVALAIDASPPDLQTAQLFAVEGTIEYLFGLFAEGRAFRVIGPGNIQLRLSAGPVVNPLTPRSFGELPYDIYYQLV